MLDYKDVYKQTWKHSMDWGGESESNATVG